MRRLIALTIIALVGASALAVVKIKRGEGRAAPVMTRVHLAETIGQYAPPPPTLRAPAVGLVQPARTSFFSWAFLDRRTGQVTASSNSATGTSTMESMIKVWIAADYLRRNRTPSAATLRNLNQMLDDSDDDMAEVYYQLGGTNAVVQRLISICHMRHTTIVPYWWAKTMMSPQDAVHYAECVADGRAAGRRWTPWLLETMRHTRGGVNDQISTQKQGGRWGIIDALPAPLAVQTSIKNGWTFYGDGWHVNCLAITQDWILSVMMRYPMYNLQYGADACAAVARSLLVYPDN